MNRVIVIAASGSIRVARFDHPQDLAHLDTDSEKTDDVSITFVEAGTFGLSQRNGSWLFRKFDVLLSVPGILRSYAHDRACPQDRCLSLAFAPEVIEDALGHPVGAPLTPKIGTCSRTRIAQHLLSRSLETNDMVATETVAFHCVLTLMKGMWTAAQGSNTGHAKSIARACEFMLEHFNCDLSLTTIAREAGMSTFHFARNFSAILGESPHQYLLRVRLFNAAKLLRAGATVTDAAGNSGFASLSHFGRVFRRQFGIHPSNFGRAKQLR